MQQRRKLVRPIASALMLTRTALGPPSRYNRPMGDVAGEPPGDGVYDAAGQIPGHVFISYVSEDSAQVDRLQRELTAQGIDVWRDRNNLGPGELWKRQIRLAIERNALAFVCCFSENSQRRSVSYQHKELKLAAEHYQMREQDRPWIFPVRFGEVELPYVDLGAGHDLNDLGRTDLFGSQRDENLHRLIDRIKVILGEQPSHTHLPRPDVGPDKLNTGEAESVVSEDRLRAGKTRGRRRALSSRRFRRLWCPAALSPACSRDKAWWIPWTSKGRPPASPHHCQQPMPAPVCDLVSYSPWRELSHGRVKVLVSRARSQ